MNIYQTYALLVIGIIILGLIVNVVVTIVDRRKLINHIHTLWRNKKPIENFIRPNSRFDYQFKLKRDQHNNLIDDKTCGLLGKVGDQDIGGAFIMLLKMAFMVDYFLFHIIQYTYYRYQDEVMACYDYVSTLDNHYSLAMRRILDTYCEPTAFSNEQTLTFTNLIHPLLENAVPNDLDINHNILLTGSNASGKSTFMKALAINLILAQTIETATADAFSYRPVSLYVNGQCR